MEPATPRQRHYEVLWAFFVDQVPWWQGYATTNSEGGMPGRMVRSQDPNESQTRLGSNDGKTLEQSLG